MKLIKPILTAGATVAMLCACGGGKKEITFDQFKQKINDLHTQTTNVFYNDVNVTGTLKSGTNPEVSVDIKFTWDNNNNSYTPGPSSLPSSDVTTISRMITILNGKSFLSYLSGGYSISKVICTENPYSIEFEQPLFPTTQMGKNNITFTEDFAVTSYKTSLVQSSKNDDPRPSYTIDFYDFQFANSGEKHTI